MNPLNYFLYLLYFLFLGSYSSYAQTDATNWCDEADLTMYSGLDAVTTSSDWFKVYTVGKDVYAIAEPYNYEEVISYLILGTEKALLFDSGNGLGSIYALVKELTNLPVTVLNSHSHYDHIGGNHEFDNILALKTEYTLYWAKNGWSHDLVKNEVAPDAFCKEKLPNIDTASYHIKPFSISTFINDGHIIDLGERTLEVISVPGHTPDAIALLDKEHGYLWTGDTFYEATIWLFFDGTDLKAYEKSIKKLADLSTSLEKLFPAHNTPIAEPVRLVELVDAFDQVMKGTKKAKNTNKNGLPVYDEEAKAIYEFDHFSFLIRRDHLKFKDALPKERN